MLHGHVNSLQAGASTRLLQEFTCPKNYNMTSVDYINFIINQNKEAKLIQFLVCLVTNSTIMKSIRRIIDLVFCNLIGQLRVGMHGRIMITLL